MRVALTVLSVALSVAYPLAIFWALTHLSPRSVSLLALGIVVPLFGLRHWRSPHLMTVLRVPLAVMLLLTLGAIFDDERLILATPVLISVALFVSFAGSLWGEVSFIERFARLRKPELSPAQVAHCRQATVAWSIFLLLNAGVAGALAWLGLRQWWALYTGLVAYLLMGALGASEYVVRQYRFRDYGRGPHDWLISRVFPPREVGGEA